MCSRIELFLFGGLTQMSRDAATPGEDFRVAAAGPLATFAFVLVCLGRRSRDRPALTGSCMPPRSTATVPAHSRAALAELAAVLMNVLLTLAFKPDPSVPSGRQRVGSARDRSSGTGQWRQAQGHPHQRPSSVRAFAILLGRRRHSG